MTSEEQRNLEEVTEFGLWWRTQDGKIQLAKVHEINGGFTEEEARELAPQIRRLNWDFEQEHIDCSKYSLVRLGQERFYVHINNYRSFKSVTRPYLTDFTYQKTSDPSRIIESKRSLIDV